MKKNTNFMAEETSPFPNGLTNICEEKRILEQHKAEWEDFKNSQRRLAGELAGNAVEPLDRTPPPLSNLEEFEKKRNSPIKVSNKTGSISMNRLPATSSHWKGAGFFVQESKVDEKRNFPFEADYDNVSVDSMRINTWNLDPIQDQCEERQDEMCNDTVDETLLVSRKSLSQFTLSPPLNLSHLKEPSLSKSKDTTKSYTFNPDLPPKKSSGAYGEILQKWMEDRGRWERCKKEYEVQLKSMQDRLQEQGLAASKLMQDLQVEKKSATSRDLQAELKAAFKKVSEIKLQLHTKADRVKYLEERCKALESREAANRDKYSDKSAIIDGLKSKLDTLRQKLEEAEKKENSELKELKLKISTSKKTVQMLEEKVEKQERTHTDLKRKFNFEVQNGERLETTINRLTNENLLLRGQQQRLRLIEVELETARAAIKHHEESSQKLQDLKHENVGLRKSNSILTEQLEVFEMCNQRFKLELERQKSQITASQLNRTNVHAAREINNPYCNKKSAVTPCLDNQEFSIPIYQQQTSQVQKQGQEDENHHRSDTSLKIPSLSRAHISQKHKNGYNCLPKDNPYIVSDSVQQSARTPSVINSIPLSHSVSSPQLSKTDVVFLRSLREMLSRYVEPTSKDKSVKAKVEESQRLQNSHLVYSQGAMIRGRSSENQKSRKKGNKSNRTKKKRSNTSNVAASKIKLIGKSVLANRKRSSMTFNSF